MKQILDRFLWAYDVSAGLRETGLKIGFMGANGGISISHVSLARYVTTGPVPATVLESQDNLWLIDNEAMTDGDEHVIPELGRVKGNLTTVNGVRVYFAELDGFGRKYPFVVYDDETETYGFLQDDGNLRLGSLAYDMTTNLPFIGVKFLFPSGNVYEITGTQYVDTYGVYGDAVAMPNGLLVGKFVEHLNIWRPSERVKSVEISKGEGSTFGVSWQVPTSMTDDKGGDDPEELVAALTLSGTIDSGANVSAMHRHGGSYYLEWLSKYCQDAPISLTDTSLDIDIFDVGYYLRGHDAVRVSRSDFAPYTTATITGVTARVAPWNSNIDDKPTVSDTNSHVALNTAATVAPTDMYASNVIGNFKGSVYGETLSQMADATRCAAVASAKISPPQPPTISDFEYDESTGHISFSISAEIGWNDEWLRRNVTLTQTSFVNGVGGSGLLLSRHDYESYVVNGDSNVTYLCSECAGVEYNVSYADSTTEEHSVDLGTVMSTLSETDVTIDAVNKSSLLANGTFSLTVRARCRGIAGDSQWVTRTLGLGFPNRPSIKRYSLSNVSSFAGTDRVIVEFVNGSAGGRGGNLYNSQVMEGDVGTIDINAYGADYVATASANAPTNVMLQKLVSVSYEKESEIPIGRAWEDTDSVDDGESTALSIALSEVYPTAGKHTWLRVAAWNMSREFTVYSKPILLQKLERPAKTAEDDEIAILSLDTGDDGTTATVVIGWNADGEDDSNGVEASWSTLETAWRSTSQPSTFSLADAMWDDGETESGGVSYGGSTTLTIADLEEGTKYYVRARRFREPVDEDEDGDTTFGPYSNTETVIPSSMPSDISLSAPAYHPVGRDLDVSWTYSGTSPQTGWWLMAARDWATEENDPILLSGEGAATSATIPWSLIEKNVLEVGSTAGAFVLYLAMTTGGRHAYSDTKVVRLAYSPRLAMPSWVCSDGHVVVPLASSSSTCSVSIVITARSSSGAAPWGFEESLSGDVVWSGVVSPPWAPYSQTTSYDYNSVLRAVTTAESDYSSMMHVADYRYGVLTESRMVLSNAISNRVENDNEATRAAVEVARENVESAMTDYVNMTSSAAPSTYDSALRPLSAAYAQLVAQQEAYDAHGRTNSVTYWATVVVPPSVAFADGRRYDIVAVATDSPSGLSSEPAMASFSTSYRHKALVPSEFVTITPKFHEDGFGITAEIYLAHTVGAFPSDVYDVYRGTADGYVLIANGVRQGSTIIDRYAPFGSSLSTYRVAMRAESGSTEWMEINYALNVSGPTDGRMLRLDWNGTFLELTHCVEVSDSYEKDFELVKHLDGSMSGHWNVGASRTLSLNAAFIKGAEERSVRLLRNLAAYDGVCFVRTSDGVAFAADVQVNDISGDYGSAKVDVSLNVTQVDMPSEFMAVLA